MSAFSKCSWRILRQTIAGASRIFFIFLLSPSAHAFIDTNNNGTSDIWEQQYNNGNLFTNFDPSADPDGDGWTNEVEAIAGTDPFDANPPIGYVRPTVTHIPAVYTKDANGGRVVSTPEAEIITWPTIAGKKYALCATPDPAAESWLAIDNIIGDGTLITENIQLTQPDGSTPEKLFWRVTINDVDSDSDGLTDAEENHGGTNPNSIDTDGDGISDADEIANGTDPTKADTDGDNVNDGQDADPLDAKINWHRTSSPQFAVIDLGIEDSENLFFDDLSDNGAVMFTRVLNPQPDTRLIVDKNQHSHELPVRHPELGDPVGYFSSYARALIGDEMLGTRVVGPAQNPTWEDCTWDPVTDTYTPFHVPVYLDEVLDARNGFEVEQSVHYSYTNGELDPDYHWALFTPYGELAGSSDVFGEYWGIAKIEKNGNIVAGPGYWRFDAEAGSYGGKSELPQRSRANSATFRQQDQNAVAGGAPVEHSWNLVVGNSNLLVAMDNGEFAASRQSSPLAVTSQGWLAGTDKIWANGKWKPLTDLVSGPKPEQVTLLDMLDTGLGVALLKFAGNSTKLGKRIFFR